MAEFSQIIEAKEPNVLAVDFGTLFAKCSLMKDSAWLEDLIVIPNKIFEISESKANTLREESKDEINIPVGIFTQKEKEKISILVRRFTTCEL